MGLIVFVVAILATKVAWPLLRPLARALTSPSPERTLEDLRKKLKQEEMETEALRLQHELALKQKERAQILQQEYEQAVQDIDHPDVKIKTPDRTVH